MVKNADLWKWLYAGWSKQVVQPIPGYTLLMLIPGDLPVFLKIALDVCRTQKSEHLVETLVIPDKLMRGFPELLETWSKNYSISPIRLVNLKPLEQVITRYQNNPHTNCWLQMVRGIEAVRTTHAVWHDADLFINQPSFLKTHYETCIESNLACLGVSKAWDSWYQEQGINHLVATWEIMLNVNWVRSFQPWEHRGHDGIVAGKPHTFDITFWPQCQTPPEQVGIHPREWGFIHFNYVISKYRWFQQSKGPFEDDSFRLLLVRLLIDAYDRSGWSYEIPLVDDLIKGITDQSNRVTYLQEQTRQRYPEFRSKLQELIESGILDEEKASSLSKGVQPFDRALGWTNSR